MSGDQESSRVITDFVGVGLVDTQNAEVIACNSAYARLLDRTPEETIGLPVEAFLAPENAAIARTVLKAMRDGSVVNLEGETETQLPSGPSKVYSWSLAIGSDPPRDRVIVGAVSIAGAPETEHPPVNLNQIILGTLDQRWRFHDIAISSASLLEWPNGRRHLMRLEDIVHPADQRAVATALRASGVGKTPTIDLRLRGRNSQWLQAQLTASRMLGRLGASLAVVMHVDPWSEDRANESSRKSGLEERLVRIAMEVEAAGVVTPLGRIPDSVRSIDRGDHSPRQFEILCRLAAGDRVPTIAKEMFISQSTVRNHLALLFKKFAVHSQAELLEVLRSKKATLPENQR